MIISERILRELIHIGLVMSITGGLLSLLLLCIKPIVCRLPKSTQYCMWLVALVSFLLPLSKIIVLPETTAEIPLTPVNFVVENTIVPVIVDPIVDKSTNTLASPAKEHVLLKWVGIVFLYAYPCVAMLIFLGGIISYFRFIRKMRRCPRIALPDELVTLEELKGKQHPRIYRSAFAVTPMLTGIFKPSIVLPDCEYANEDLRPILLHELTHLRQYDVVIKWLSLIVCALHWINPVAWIMRHEIDRIAELSCDEKVIRNMDNDEKQSYGDMLIAIAAYNTKPPSAVLSTTLCEDKIVLKERLAAIMQSKKRTKAEIAVSTAVVFAMISVACVLGAASTELSIEPPKTQAASASYSSSYISTHRTLRASDYYYVAIDEFAFKIQADGDVHFIPPKRAEFSFTGTLDEIKEWATTIGRSTSMYAQYDKSINTSEGNYMDDGTGTRTSKFVSQESFREYIVIDLYNENGILTASLLENSPRDILEVPFQEFDPYIHERHSYLQPNIHAVWFIGTHKELWKLGTTNICKPSDMYPIVITTGSRFYDGERAVAHPDVWDADSIVSAEFAVFGNFAELMGFWGYTEEELLDVFMNSAPVGSYYWKSADIDQLNTFYTVIEYFDEAHNLIGREFLYMVGDRPDSQDIENMQILFFKTYDEYEAWLNQN